MDPLTVIRTVWHHKAYVFPVLLVTLIAAAYVFQFGPRYYESSMSYAMVNPKVPTDQELETNPGLAGLNRDNPFLRASDPSLISEVLIARLSNSKTAESLKTSGLSRDYTVLEGINGNGFVVSITGHGESEVQALETTRALGVLLESELRTIQKVSGADDRYLFTALMVNPPDKATEQFSSRLRSLIMVVLGGVVLMFGAVSLGRSLESVRLRRSRTADPAAVDRKANPDKPAVRRDLPARGAPSRPRIALTLPHTSGGILGGARDEVPAPPEPARR